MVGPVIPGMVRVEVFALVMRARISPVTDALGVVLRRRRDEAARVMGTMPMMVVVKERQSGSRSGDDDSREGCVN